MTVSKLKKELDKWFSLYIRLREATDEGLVQCFTCGKVNIYKEVCTEWTLSCLEIYATRYDEQNCQVQCVGCNMFKFGEQFKFSLALDAKYGKGTAEELLHKSKINKIIVQTMKKK
jgi:hypothetical protein